MTKFVAFLAVCTLAAPMTAAPAGTVASSANEAADEAPTLLTWSQQMRERDAWLAKRHRMLLGMMRQASSSVWWSSSPNG